MVLSCALQVANANTCPSLAYYWALSVLVLVPTLPYTSFTFALLCHGATINLHRFSYQQVF